MLHFSLLDFPTSKISIVKPSGSLISAHMHITELDYNVCCMSELECLFLYLISDSFDSAVSLPRSLHCSPVGFQLPSLET